MPRPARVARLWPLALAALLGLATAASATPARPARARIGGPLAGLLEADGRGDAASFARIARTAGARFAAGLVEVQLHLAPGFTPESLHDADLHRFGGRSGARGIDLMDAWLPLRALPAFLDAQPGVAFAQLPWRGVPVTGPVLGEGAKLLRTPQASCLAADGAGMTVAVLDAGFTGLDASMAKGELPHVAGKVAQTGGTHGTMCAEVVADVAPSVTVVPIQGGSFAAVQALVKKITSGGNPDSIDVISHSVIWFGMGFGRHEGPACALTDLVRSAGVAWVNASGNSGSGQFYLSAFVDADADQRHDFQKGQPRLMFQQMHPGSIQLALDWDDYAKREQDFDLVLVRKEGETWQEVADSRNPHGAFMPPYESIQHDAPPGIYAAVVEAGKTAKPGTRLRLVNLGSGGGTFSVFHKNGNVYEPGSCDGVLTVGAIFQGQYASGPLEGYSSYGPTPDGRLKPEVMAPTGVATSHGGFWGTSAACPHAAAVLAIYAQALGTSAVDAIPSLVADAVPMGQAHPDEAYGWGRAVLDPETLGWQCDAAVAPPVEATCTTACGSVGTRACQAGCRWAACTVPPESCNGLDDDCDGQPDDGLGCMAGRNEPCTLACGLPGERTCTSACSWTPCTPVGASCATTEPCPGPGCPDVSNAEVDTIPVVPSHDSPSDPGGCTSHPISCGNHGSWLWLGLASALAVRTRRRPVRRTGTR